MGNCEDLGFDPCTRHGPRATIDGRPLYAFAIVPRGTLVDVGDDEKAARYGAFELAVGGFRSLERHICDQGARLLRVLRRG